MRSFSRKREKKAGALLALLLAVMLLPLACLGETAVTADSAGEYLFDDDQYYDWLYGGEEDKITDAADQYMELYRFLIR